MFKRSLAVLLSLLMLFSVVSVAGAEEKATDPTNIYGGLVALDDANDPITFTLFVRDPGMEPAADNPVIKKIQELTGVTVDGKYMDASGKFDLDAANLVAYSHGDYMSLGEKLGSFGFSVKK